MRDGAARVDQRQTPARRNRFDRHRAVVQKINRRDVIIRVRAIPSLQVNGGDGVGYIAQCDGAADIVCKGRHIQHCGDDLGALGLRLRNERRHLSAISGHQDHIAIGVGYAPLAVVQTQADAKPVRIVEHDVATGGVVDGEVIDIMKLRAKTCAGGALHREIGDIQRCRRAAVRHLAIHRLQHQRAGDLTEINAVNHQIASAAGAGAQVDARRQAVGAERAAGDRLGLQQIAL